MKIIILVLSTLLIISCGGGGSSGGSKSSFNASEQNPVIDNLQVGEENNESNQSKENIIPITGSEVNITVKENTRVAFKVNATDRSSLTYYLTEGDFNELYIDQKTGETFFKEPTDYERKSKYNFKIIIEDSVGHETKQQIFISVDNTKNEQETIKPIEVNSELGGDEKRYFITTWKTDNVGISNDNQIIIPTAGDGYNYSVDWGDGTSSKQLTLDAKHTYKNTGTYKIKISGEFPRIHFGQNVDYDLETYENDSRKIISIDQWGTNRWESMAGAFTECTFLEGKASDTPDLSNVKDMSTMFAVSNFNQDINNWNISTIENLQMMFFFSSFNQNIGNWNTSNVTDMSGLFGLTFFNKSIVSWDTQKVTNMGAMFFSNSAFNQNIGNWNTSNVTEMSAMFSLAISFNQNISRWDTSNVKAMAGMFLGASGFNQNISNWNISEVNDMSQMFQFATSFNQDLESWHISTETNKEDIFTATDALTKLPTWYTVDDDIKKRRFIVIVHNANVQLCTVGEVSENIEKNNFGDILEFEKHIDKSSLITSTKNSNFACSQYDREDEFVDCITVDVEDFRGNSCVVGFNFEQ